MKGSRTEDVIRTGIGRRAKASVEDNEIIALFFKRDEQAIAALGRKYRTYCMKIAVSILDSEADAEECVSDATLALWNAIPPERPVNLRTYLGRVVRNLSINRLQHEKRKRRDRDMTVALDELAECLPDDAQFAAEDSHALDRLPEYISAFLHGEEAVDRRLFVGRYWYNYAVADMAAAYGLTPNAASLRLRRTRERLRRYLNERGIIV